MKQGFPWCPCLQALSPPQQPFHLFSIQQTKHRYSPVVATLDSVNTQQQQLTPREKRQIRSEAREEKSGYKWKEEVEDMLVGDLRKKKKKVSNHLKPDFDKLPELGTRWWLIRVPRFAEEPTAEHISLLLASNFPDLKFKVYAPAVELKRKLKNGTYSVRRKIVFPKSVFLWCELNRDIHKSIKEWGGIEGFHGVKLEQKKKIITFPRPIIDMENFFQRAKEEQEKADQAFEKEQQAGDLEKLGPSDVAKSVVDSQPKGRAKKISDPLVNGSSRKNGNKLLVHGSTVRIVSGTFADFVGSLKKFNLKTGKVTVEFTLFGKQSSADLDLNEVVVEIK